MSVSNVAYLKTLTTMNVIIITRNGIKDTPMLIEATSTAEATFDNVAKELVGEYYEDIEEMYFDYVQRYEEVKRHLDDTGVEIDWYEDVEVNTYGTGEDE